MNIIPTKLVYFSPTGTTKTVLEGISQGIGAPSGHVDLTQPYASARHSTEMQGELAIIGSPVYAGRIPVDFIVRFQQLKGNGMPAVIVVVYGNRAYEDALLELRDIVLEAGFIPFAAGAFIGEHSYSTAGSPIAAGRPDAEDLRKAGEFGRIVQEKITDLQALDNMRLIKVPGRFPYKEIMMLSDISPVTNETVCSKCGTCASVCPTAAIAVKDAVATDRSLCIRCCACVKSCASRARVMDDERIKSVAGQLSVNCSKRKEPETYL